MSEKKVIKWKCRLNRQPNDCDYNESCEDCDRLVKANNNDDKDNWIFKDGPIDVNNLRGR